jgi:hypothetical protein
MPALTFYDVQNSAATSYLDLGTVAAATSDDTQLRVYNTSGAYQAEDVTVALDGSSANDLYLSLNGDTFTATVKVGDIPPGAYSPVITVRRVTDHLNPAGVHTARLLATPARWSLPDDIGTSTTIPLDTTED